MTDAPSPRATSDADAPRRRSPMPVPPVLADLAAWTWRVLVLVLALYLSVRFLARLYLVVLPFAAALFASALLMPFVRWLQGRGLPRGAATGIVLVVGLALLGGIMWFVVDRASAQYSDLVDQLSGSVSRIRNSLVNGPFHLRAASVDNVQQTVTKWLQQHRATVASGVVTTVGVVGEALVGLVLALFTTFFLLYDGEHIWGWFLRLLPAAGREPADRAGHSAWLRVSGFVRGTFLIACFHGAVMGISLAVMGVPLVAPLALMVFLGSFIPIVGAVIFGGLAVLVTFGTKGFLLAVVLVGILVVANQVESHVLQPFLVGRYVHLHPLAVALSITAGSLLFGIVGAILAVPLVSAADAVVRSLAAEPGESPERAADTADSRLVEGT